jgi:hypothetical protein
MRRAQTAREQRQHLVPRRLGRKAQAGQRERAAGLGGTGALVGDARLEVGVRPDPPGPAVVEDHEHGRAHGDFLTGRDGYPLATRDDGFPDARAVGAARVLDGHRQHLVLHLEVKAHVLARDHRILDLDGAPRRPPHRDDPRPREELSREDLRRYRDQMEAARVREVLLTFRDRGLGDHSLPTGNAGHDNATLSKHQARARRTFHTSAPSPGFRWPFSRMAPAFARSVQVGVCANRHAFQEMGTGGGRQPRLDVQGAASPASFASSSAQRA